MLSIKQSTDHVTNQKLTGQVPLRYAITNLSSHVIVSACRQLNPTINLSFMNQELDHLFEQERQVRHISIKFRHIFYNIARKLSEPER